MSRSPSNPTIRTWIYGAMRFLWQFEDRHGTSGLNHVKVKNKINYKICGIPSDMGL